MYSTEPRWRPWPAAGATKDQRRDCCRALEDGCVKALVAEFEERGAEFLGHIDTPAAAVLRGGKHAVGRIIGSLHMHKPVRVVGVLPELDIFPVQSRASPSRMPVRARQRK